jgi:hypothetical protein
MKSSASRKCFSFILNERIKSPRFLILREGLKLTLSAADSATKKIPGYSMQINDFLPQRHSLSGRNGKK